MAKPLKDIPKVVIVVPNWNGADGLRACLDSLVAQTLAAHIIVVDNGSIDDSIKIMEEHFQAIEIIKRDKNYGYTGGVNPGFQWAIDHGYDYVAPFNNDAVADKDWALHLADYLQDNPHVGIAACKILSEDGSHLDSTGDYYTHWGLPYPRGRGETDIHKYDNDTEIFGASGGASMYRVSMLKEIGLLDDDFFAYYEDLDLSFRAQLAGWKVSYVPTAIVFHAYNTTSGKIKGFLTYMTMKNLPWLLWKNVPLSLLPTVFPRFFLVYSSFFVSAAGRGQLYYAIKGHMHFLWLLPKKLAQRRRFKQHVKVNAEYIRFMLHWDLPPNATRWRNVRSKYWRLAGKTRT